jgi:hypothetical protein
MRHIVGTGLADEAARLADLTADPVGRQVGPHSRSQCGRSCWWQGLFGARMANQAGSGEVLIFSTVKDLVAGSGLRFCDRGAPS